MDGLAADQQGGRRGGAFPGDGEPGTVYGGGAGPTTWMAGQTYSAAAGGAVQRKNNKELCSDWGSPAGDSPAGLPQADQDKDSAHDEAPQYQNQQSSDAGFQVN